MKYISLFAGIGGFDLALNRLGHVCVWANEWDKYAAQIYNKNFIRPLQQEDTERPKERQLTKNQPHQREHLGNGVDTRDITTVLTSEIPDHDLLVGGFPCQSFSIAGKRRGFDDTRGTLFFEIARILKDKQPKYFILENVKGLLSHEGGNTFKTIIATLTELGYDLQWQVLNSKNFGVPQNRERVFIIGHLRGTSRPEVFPIETSNGANAQGVKRKRITSARTRNFGSSGQLHQPDEQCSTLTQSMGTGGNNVPCMVIPTINPDRENIRQSRRFKGDGEPSFTLTGQDKHGVGIGTTCDFCTMPKSDHKYCEEGWLLGGTLWETSDRDTYKGRTADGLVSLEIPDSAWDRIQEIRKQILPIRIRRLTPTECERLQGFPEIEKYSIITVCKQVNADGAERVLNIKVTDQDSVAQSDVLINCVENGAEIHSQGKLLLNAKNAEKKNWSHPHIKIEDFVQLLVGTNTIVEKITKHGEGDYLQKEQCSMVQRNGKKQENKCGNEITQPVGTVENDLITLKELLKYTMLNHSDTRGSEQKLIILSSFVTRAIIGYIPEKILNQSTFTIGIKTRVGYTYGISDTQRYKCLGNAVTVNVIQAIAERLV